MDAAEKQKSDSYQPFAPKAHQILFDAYYNALHTEDPETCFLYCAKAQGIIEAIMALKNDGFIPPLATKGFLRDILHVKSIAHEKISLGNLSDAQSGLTFAIANLHNEFDRKV